MQIMPTVMKKPEYLLDPGFVVLFQNIFLQGRFHLLFFAQRSSHTPLLVDSTQAKKALAHKRVHKKLIC